MWAKFCRRRVFGLTNWRIQRRKGDSLSAGRDHLNSVDRNDADVSCPDSIRHNKRARQPFGRSPDEPGTEQPRIVPMDFDAEQRSAKSLCQASIRCGLRLPPNPTGRRPLRPRDPCEPTGHRGPGLEAPQQSASESSRRRGGASTPELGRPYIRGPDNWRTPDKRGCPLASGQGS